MVEPLIEIIQRPKDNGARLTGLAVISVCNMLNFSDDIKDIFMMKQGFPIIMELLNSKDKDVILNTLRLIMSLIKKPKSGVPELGKQLAAAKLKDEEMPLVKRLIRLVKYGP